MEETLIYYFSFYFSIKTILAAHKNISKQADNYSPFMVSNKERRQWTHLNMASIFQLH